MYKTLADMTPEQRAACVGMWCDVRVPFKEDQKNLVILTHVDSGPKRAKVFGTGIGMTWSKRLQDVTPRCDLPRAWNPDGTPLAEKREWRVESTKGAEFASTPWTDEKEARDIVQKSRNALTALGIDPTGHVRLVRRLVSQPEGVKP